MIRLARVLIGTAAGLTLLLVGFDPLSWQYWVLVLIVLVHSMAWSHLDWLEREQRNTTTTTQRKGSVRE